MKRQVVKIGDVHGDRHLESPARSYVGQTERERSDIDLRGWELEQREVDGEEVRHAGHGKNQEAHEEHEAAVDAAAAARRRY